MRYFLDWEFNEEVDPLEPISLGIVCSDGREFYAINEDYNINACGEWLQKHVVSNLYSVCEDDNRGIKQYKIGNVVAHSSQVLMPLGMIRQKVERFVTKFGTTPQFWGWYSDYDWYLFCRLFGGMLKMPNGFPELCLDVKQWAFHLGVQTFPPQFIPEHNALVDARWTARVWEYLHVYAVKRTCV